MQTHCSCGQPFVVIITLGGVVVRYWCLRCDVPSAQRAQSEPQGRP